ncbi:Clavaminate synthase-like protein [Suillus subaureus]|uniref:Clavaminate synthase-like protein n=1 Tax=Suillus subaureus TaxID=48587 RepID=A0A9P7JJL4_9AGAM|nr:Clavaminate synthase-like protein [Suillus subaureus]KAG1826255.1 Clavaminate synthase-like protein [Suillus subaureus]
MSTDVVSISYQTLVSSPSSLETSIEEAFGSHSQALGIILVKDLPPVYPVYRERLLKFAYDFAHLDEDIREKYVDPGSIYSYGWSHGKEIMNGRPGANDHVYRLLAGYLLTMELDTLKGSYYANPVVDVPDVNPAVKAAYPPIYGNNIWPDKNEIGIEGFEEAFKDLGGFVFDVGRHLAGACQPFVSKYLTDVSLSVPELISTQTAKARLLHYFPPSENSPTAEDEPIDSWCGFHKDHSLLTGLCSAIFLREEAGMEPTAVPSPSPTSGLYIRTRGRDLTKVSIPPDCLAFQTGEALELVTAGKLRATPHCVRVGQTQVGAKISRETFALFMQPDTHQRISESDTFGSFSKKVLEEHYKEARVI